MDFKFLEKLLDGFPNLGIPGVDCIVQIGYDTVFRHSAGFADREKQIPVSGNETFNLYSSTKPVTCTAALQLYEQGKFLLSDPVYEYLPEFRFMDIEERDAAGEKTLRPAKNPIRVADLFSMTAGFDYELDKKAFQETLERTKGKAPTREMIRALAGEPLHYEPGTRWHYSLAHDVLGALIEVVSGERFGAYLKKHVFEPLGMKHTGFVCSPQMEERMMAQYKRDPKTGKVERIGPENPYIFGPEYESGGAGLISCVEDYARFAAALANGGTAENGERILSPATIGLMHKDQLNDRKRADFQSYFPHFTGYGYGLGVRTLVDGAAAGSNGPEGEFGWPGAAGVNVLIDTKNKISMFYAQHMLESLEPYTHRRLRNVLYACL